MCAIGPDFEDLATSLAGWGDSPAEAREALAKRYLKTLEPVSVPLLSDFKVLA